MTLSPLAPSSFPDLPKISGINLATAASGTRYKGRDDLLLITLAPDSSVAGVFTKSDTAAAPVRWSQTIAKTGKARAIITNAGNANAFTGMLGHKAVHDMATGLAAKLKCDANTIMIASTGVIGEPLDVTALTPFFGKLVDNQTAGWQAAANAILTTDTFAKGSHAKCVHRWKKSHFVRNRKGVRHDRTKYGNHAWLYRDGCGIASICLGTLPARSQ